MGWIESWDDSESLSLSPVCCGWVLGHVKVVNNSVCDFQEKKLYSQLRTELLISAVATLRERLYSGCVPLCLK